MREVNEVLLEQASEGTAEPETADMVYRALRAEDNDPSRMEGSTIEAELRAILQLTPDKNEDRNVLRSDDENPEHDEELDMQHRRERTETDAKAGATRHPSRQLNGTVKRTGNPADAKVGSTQHSLPKRPNKSYSQPPRFQHPMVCRYQGLASTHALENTSTEDTRCGQQRNVAGTDPSSESSSDTEIGISSKRRTELRNRRRRNGETLQNLHKDIRRLAALAYPNVPPQSREEVACDHFLDALEDAGLVFRIQERHPVDLDSALQLALQFKKAPLSDYYISRCLTSGRTDLAVEALRQEMKEMKKWMKFEHRAPTGPVRGHRQPAATGHTIPSVYGGVPSAPLSSRGLHPANHGNRSSLVRPVSNCGCFNCGIPAHRAPECPVPSAEHPWS